MISAFHAIQYMQQETLTAAELNYGCRSRIHEFDLLLNALLNINIDSSYDASESDFIRKNSSNIAKNQPLLGIPLIVKDVFKTKLLPTTGGMEAFEFHETNETAEIVDMFLQAGAYLIAKSNIPALALDVQTFNHIKPACNNPWNLAKTPGGSSGGSAVAVACGYAPLALGTDLNGSMRIPAAYTGVFSYKSSDGKFSTKGLFPPIEGSSANFRTLTIGVFANYVIDLEIAYFIMEGYKQFENASILHQSPLKIAISEHFEHILTDDRIVAKMEALAFLLQQSFTVEHVAPDFTRDESLFAEIIRAQEIFANRFIHSDASSENPIADNSIIPSNEEYEWAVTISERTKAAIDEILSIYDVWITPVSPILPFDHNPQHQPLQINGTEVSYWKAIVPYCTPFSVSGHPVVTIPIGLIEDLPVGVQVVGKNDLELLQCAKKITTVIPRLPMNPIVTEEY